ncbi:unnamed protein product [Thelazia callipaeda]|uniref:LSDAT_euk domain-containing protein n=1 Tax=Thelazia callipaeda TaxID=103827 RepID=A0A158RBG4_THECL|nr:unnamed protein product [Thelazia callipaeda]
MRELFQIHSLIPCGDLKIYSMTLLATKGNAPRNSVCSQQFKSLTNMPCKYFQFENEIRKGSSKLLDRPEVFVQALNEKLKEPWIEQVFSKRECVKYIPTFGVDRCGCGLSPSGHNAAVMAQFTGHISDPCTRLSLASGYLSQWNTAEHTEASHTDAFGTLEFSGGAHAHRAHYVRLGHDSDPSDIMYLMEKVWGLEPPRLVITVHGGLTNFEVQEKVGQVFRASLLKAAQTTGAWIITGGIDAGVNFKIDDICTSNFRMRSKVITIGIAPWGLLRGRERLIGKDIVVSYDPYSFSSKSKYVTLNDRHSYFLLVDNGTYGRYGADIILRKRFEEFIARKQTIGLGTRHVPVVCAVLEGGICTIRAILHYLANQPPVPVIVCDGSGRASNLIAFAHKHILEDGTLPKSTHAELLTLIGSTFQYSATSAEQILEEILCCAKHRDLLTIFRLGESNQQDVDHAILSVILKGQNLSSADQLALTLIWNRVDIARSDIFVPGQNWHPHLLYNAMMEALALNRVDFVKLLLENGVSMKKFLTINRLEQLYNMEHESILPLINSVTSLSDRRITLPKIGVAIERLMGNAYKCSYTTRRFKNKYEKCKKNALFLNIWIHFCRFLEYQVFAVFAERIRKHDKLLKYCFDYFVYFYQKRNHSRKQRANKELREGEDFQYPFNDLMLWAILSRRQDMARCMWMYGEEPMAKALAAIRLYKSMSKEAADEYIEVEASNELREFAEEFKRESLNLLNHCYLQDDSQTLRLLTAELPNWSHYTCLSLAVVAHHLRFLAHPCCQILLADLWHGGLGIKRYILQASLAFPPSILLLDVKARISPNRCNNTFPSQHFVMNEIESVEKDDDRSQNSVCSSLHLSGHLKLRRKNRRSTAAFPQRLTNLLETSNLIEEAYRTKFGSKTQRKSIAASLQGIGELARKTSWATKFNIFYSAPITTFWIWLVSYSIFLAIYTYVILIEFPAEPTKVEWFLLAYVVAFVMEHIRKLLVQKASSIVEKIQVYFNRCWNYLTFLATVTFFIGFAFRCNSSTRHSYGRVILSCNIVFWYIKLLDFMGVHPRLGPYIQMTCKMIVNMMYILALLLVTLMPFGISRQAITYPHEKWQWILIRNIFYKPYFMLYGEVYAGEIDTCGDEGINCVPGSWIPPILMTIFLLVANILLINMLIAIFNNIFNETNAIAQHVWLFQRYEQVMEYGNTPFFPPPLTPISHLFIVIKYLWKLSGKCNKKRQGASKRGGFFDFSMKLRLNDDELRALHDFEEDCMDDLSRKQNLSQQFQDGSHLNITATKTDNLQVRLNNMAIENDSVKWFLREIHSRLDAIEKNQKTMMLHLTRNTASNNNQRDVTKMQHYRNDECKFLNKAYCVGDAKLTRAHVNFSNSEEEMRKYYDLQEISEKCDNCDKRSQASGEKVCTLAMNTPGMNNTDDVIPSFDILNLTEFSTNNNDDDDDTDDKDDSDDGDDGNDNNDEDDSDGHEMDDSLQILKNLDEVSSHILAEESDADRFKWCSLQYHADTYAASRGISLTQASSSNLKKNYTSLHMQQ